MKLNDLYGGVPENVSQRIEKTVMGLPEEEVKERGIRLSRPLAIALSCVVAVALMTATAFTVGLFTDREEREQQFVDPYAEQIMQSSTDNGITMTINKIAMDFNTDYIYFTLKNENGVFEKQPEFDEISYKNDYLDWKIDTKFDGMLGFTALGTSDYDPENPSDTIHAVLRAKLPTGKVTLNFDGLNSTDGEISYADGYSFDIDIGKNRKVINDIIQQGIFDEDRVKEEFKKYDKQSEVMEYKLFKPNDTIRLDGNELKVTELYISPYQVSVTLEDDMSGSVKVGELEFYPSTLITMSTEYLRKEQAENELVANMTPEERDGLNRVHHVHGDNGTKYEDDFSIDGFIERNRIRKEEGEEAAREFDAKRAESYYFGFCETEIGMKITENMQNPEYWDLMDDARYKLGIEFAPGVEAELIGWDNGGSYFKVADSRENSLIYATTNIQIDRAVCIDEIERIYFYKYSDPSVQVDIWVNK